MLTLNDYSHRGVYARHFLVVLLILGLSACGQMGKRSPAPVTDDFSSIQDTGPRGPVDLSRVREPSVTKLAKSKYGNPETYVVFGKTYRVKATARGYREKGIASWYGTKFHGRRTSSGEPYDMYQYTAAHKSLPIPVFARVTNLQNGESIIVRINDRGPFHDNRIIDLSYAAAHRLGIAAAGTGLVEVVALTGDEQSVPADEATSAHAVKVKAYPGTAASAATPIALAAPEPLQAPQAEPLATTAPAGGKTAAAALNTNGTARPPQPLLYLQVGAFSQEANATRLRDRLQTAGIEGISVAVPGKLRDDDYYRVVLGPLENVQHTDRLSVRLHEMGISNTRVIVD